MEVGFLCRWCLAPVHVHSELPVFVDGFLILFICCPSKKHFGMKCSIHLVVQRTQRLWKIKLTSLPSPGTGVLEPELKSQSLSLPDSLAS